jgi:hypothetical protein
MYNYCVSGYYLEPCLYLFKTFVREMELCLCLQVEPTQLGPIDRNAPIYAQ